MIAIIDYRAGNIRSVQNALNRLGRTSEVTRDKALIQQADHIIFPGVGHATSALQHLREAGLEPLIPELKQPFLGICLGLQLLCEASEEGSSRGLGVFPVQVKKFDETLAVPHMGWNSIQHDGSPLFHGIPQESDFYFVHSYYAEKADLASATANYGIPFSAALARDNFQATQFHPEKSGEAGLQLLQNFLNL